MSPRQTVATKDSGATWVGQIPTNWVSLRAKWLFSQARRPRLPDDEQLSATQRHGVVPQKLFMEMEGQQVVLALSGTENFRHVDKDDFVISLRSFQGGIERCHYAGCVTPAYTVLVNRADMCKDFFAYLLKSDGFIGGLQVATVGIREGKSISFDEFGEMLIPTPPLFGQVEIARYLDDQTARIDSLIEKKKRFIEILREKKDAVAATSVTRGILPKAVFRHADVAWIGSVPSHWTTMRIADLFREADRPADPELPVLSVSINSGVTDRELADEDRQRVVNLSEDRTKYQGVKPGDLVYNMMRAWQGAFGTVTVQGLVSPAYVVAEPKAIFRTKFVEMLLQTATGAEEVRRYSKGIADFRQRLYWEHFRNLKICLPPLAEQDKIIQHIETETARISYLVSKTERSIELLKEHRSALITAAVTGKIDVRGFAAKNMKVAA